MLNVMCFGEALIDFLPVDDGYQPMSGGAPANVAVAVSKLGGSSFFVGGLSQDVMGQKLLSELKGYGVNCDNSLVVPNKTALVLVSLDKDGERSFQFYRDNTADQQVKADSLKQIDWAKMHIFHFCSNTLTDEQSAEATMFALQQIKHAGGIVSFDVNLRLSLWSAFAVNSKLVSEQIDRVWPYVDLIKLSSEELDYLAAANSMSSERFVDNILNKGVHCVLITDGPELIRCFTKQASTQFLPPKVKAVDTTAAGDSFVGGLLFQLSHAGSCLELVDWLSNTTTLETKLEFASKCGAYTVQRKGAFSALPNKDNSMCFFV